MKMSSMKEIFLELEDYYLETGGVPIHFTREEVRAVSYIFIQMLLNKFWDRADRHNIEQKEREQAAEMMGYELRALILKYTDIDTHTLRGFNEN